MAKRKNVQAEDRVGERYGRWLIIGPGETDGKTRKVLCRCACGVERLTSLKNLMSGMSQGCMDCLSKRKREAASKCVDCGVVTQGERCISCFRAKKELEGPVAEQGSVGHIALLAGVSKQAVWQMVDKHGFRATIDYYEDVTLPPRSFKHARKRTTVKKTADEWRALS